MGKRLKPEEIIAKLREVEVRLARGETAAQAAGRWITPRSVLCGPRSARPAALSRDRPDIRLAQKVSQVPAMFEDA